MGKRDTVYDEIAGLLVIYMIAYHVMQWAGMRHSSAMAIMSWLNFFMPWFFFKAGMFFREKDRKQMFRASSRRLLVPFVVWSIIGAVVFGVISCFVIHTHTYASYLKMNVYQLITEGTVPGNQPLWFLLALFVARMVFNECMLRHINILLPTLAGIAISIGLHFTGLNVPHYVNYICSGIFFFGVGILLKEKCAENWFKICSIALYVLLSTVSMPIVDFRENTLQEGFFLLWPVWSVAGIVTVNALFEYMHKAVRKPLRVLEYVGRKSMTFYVVHWPVIMIVFYIIKAVRV